MMFFKKKMESVYAAKKKHEHMLEVFRLQIDHFNEYGFEPPLDTLSKLSSGNELIQQFEQIEKDPAIGLKERREKQAMLLGYEEIFTDSIKAFEDDIHIMCNSWNEQFRCSQYNN